MEPSPAGNYGTAKLRKASSFRARTPHARKRTKENYSSLLLFLFPTRSYISKFCIVLYCTVLLDDSSDIF